MDSEENQSTTPPASRLKFGLRQLFYATALIAAGLALSSYTIWASLLVLLVWGHVFSNLGPRVVFGGIMIVLFFAMVTTPVMQTCRGPHHEFECQNNLKIIALAILNYESGYGHFPTDRIVTLADGTELRHSWRIGITPFMEGSGLPAFVYNYNEPWNGPNNSKLASRMPDSFACPSRDHGTKTPYKLVNGPGTAFEVGKKTSSGQLNDGTYNTIALIEDHANPTNWMEPGDFTAEEAAQAMNSLKKDTAVHGHESSFMNTYFGCNYAMLDGGTYRWSAVPTGPMEPGAFLIDDGYLFDRNVQGQPLLEPKYGVWFALAIYLLLILLPSFFLSNAQGRLMDRH